MAKNSSSSFDSITSKVLIRPGTPAVYRLIPKKDYIGTITRVTLGTKNVSKINKTILLVGETGTGKSTLINALVNYALGVKWEDDVWFEIVEKEKKNSQCESQTSDVVVYEVFGFEGKTLPYSLTIIDTPGYRDNKGTEHDDIVSQRLLHLFSSEDGVHEIAAVGLVLRATENRVSDRLMHIFDSVLSLFGKNMENNIVALITHSGGRKPKNVLSALEAVNIKCARDENKQPVYFLFDNCQHEVRAEDTEELEHADDITTKGMRQFTDFLKTTDSQKLQTTMNVLKERIRLKACVENLQERVEFIEKKQKDIQETENMLERHKQEVKSNKDFVVQTTETYKEKEWFNGGSKWWALWLNNKGAVCCTTCEENCHYECTMAWTAALCKVMEDDKCTVCNCPAPVHVKVQWRYVPKSITVSTTLQGMKEKYDQGKADSEEAGSLLENLLKEMRELQRDKDQWLDESFQHVVRLEKIALNVDSLSTLVHLDFLIKRMKEKRDAEKVQKLEEMKSRVDEGIQVGMRYKKGAGGETRKLD
uniref:uncharacterized protein n=1 Tax=Semicossyphus pulcher TaxID=241346 RepID=UPI0037E89B96